MRPIELVPPGDLRGTPAMIVGNRDVGRLRALVERHAGGPEAGLAEQLDADLQRAVVVPQAQVPPGVVGLGSRVLLEELETSLRAEFVLALPAAERGARQLSILSPLGLALLGAAAGETVEYAAPDGRFGEVRVLSVTRGGDGP